MTKWPLYTNLPNSLRQAAADTEKTLSYMKLSETLTMADNRLATVAPVSESAASGKVAEIYADIKRTKKIDFVPNFWCVLATSPDQLELVWTRLKSLMHPEATGRTSPLDARTREIIALAV